MELIIGGTRKGLSVLATVFCRASEDLSPELHDSIRVDDSCELLVLPSVFLNLHGPLVEHDECVSRFLEETCFDIPDGMEWAVTGQGEPYEIITYEDLYGRIPIR